MLSLEDVLNTPNSLETATLDEKREIQLKIIQSIFEKQENKHLSSRDIKQMTREGYASLWPYLEQYWNSNISSLATEENASFHRIPGSYNYAPGPVPYAPGPVPTIEVPEDEGSVLSDGGGAVINAEEDDANVPPVRREKEKNLYPCLVEWLRVKGYMAKNTSLGRTGAAWGHPDIVGIKVIPNIFGHESLEICSIEAKPSQKDWRRFIFEAISHKRFANRTYFAFAIGASMAEEEYVPELADLRKYAEKYRIGILAIFLNEDTFRDLHQYTDLSLNDVIVREIWPAHYDEADLSDSTQFCRDQLGLTERGMVYKFGVEDLF